METYPGDETAIFTRVNPAGTLTLELWTGIYEDRPLRTEEQGHYYRTLIGFCTDLWHGKALLRDPLTPAQIESIKEFETLVICGGRLEPKVAHSENYRGKPPFAVVVPENPRFRGLAGLEVIARHRGFHRPLLIDWGQSSIKLRVHSQELTEIINREYELFPLIKDCELRPETAHSRLRHYYHKLISRFKSDIDSVFLALPVEINHKGVAQPSSYQGMGGNLSTLFSLSAQTPVYVLNDAEAAAVGSHEYLHGKSLVLTVGSGLGGCLCHEIF